MPERTTIANKAALAALLLLAACGHSHASIEAIEPPTNWHQVATQEDRVRLRNWRDAWVDATAKVRAAGHGAQLDDALFQFDVAQADPLPPPGDYRCRVYKLGSSAPTVQDFTSYAPVPCRVARDGEVLSFEMLAGPQRSTGLIFKDIPGRGVLLGTLMLGDETRPLSYGRDSIRDIAGLVEHVGPGRYRIAFPRPHFESTLDVIELQAVR